MMLGTNSDIPASIMGLVSTYLASFFLFCKLPFKWYLAMDCFSVLRLAKQLRRGYTGKQTMEEEEGELEDGSLDKGAR